MTETTPPPVFYHRTAGGFEPTGLARNPWHRGAISGAAIGGLLAVLVDEADLDSGFDIARMTIDIFGMVPFMELEGRIVPVHGGRQTQTIAAELVAAGRVVARASVLRVRHAPTPPVEPPSPYPAPDDVAETDYMPPKSFGGAIRTRPVQGNIVDPGHGILWAAFDAEIVAGTPLTPLVRAAIIGDFGVGVGSSLPRSDWTFANLDITLQFLRMPRGDWVLIDAQSHGAGNGHATAINVFADRDGVYARGFQTLFVAPVIARD